MAKQPLLGEEQAEFVKLQRQAMRWTFLGSGLTHPQVVALLEEIAPGYENLNYTVRIKGDATREEFADIHQAVMKTSPNFYNLSRAVRLNASLYVG